MRTWNTPAILDLDVRMTASQGVESTTEQPGGLYGPGGSMVYAQYNSTLWERESADCFVPKKDSVQS